jgi:hypothetical protein
VKDLLRKNAEETEAMRQRYESVIEEYKKVQVLYFSSAKRPLYSLRGTTGSRPEPLVFSSGLWN